MSGVLIPFPRAPIFTPPENLPAVIPGMRQENPIIDGTTLWLRKWQLSIGTQEGSDALDLSQLAFEFQIDQATNMTPWTAQFTIYNINNDIISKMRKELTVISLQAGYQPPSVQYGKIFAGPIAYFKHGRLNATDTFVEIHASQYDIPINTAVVNTVLPQGYKKTDILTAATAEMDGVSVGHITDLGDEAAPRSRVLYGMSKDSIYDVAQSAEANAWVDSDGKLNMLKTGESLPTVNVPVLNTHTGLVEVPTQTLGGGVDARVLLNHAIIPGGQVHLDNSVLQQFVMVNESAMLPDTVKQLGITSMAFNAQGYYVVVAVRHWGQNRGNPWYTDIKTEAMDPSGPQKPSIGSP